jgi:ribonuclease P/MRP protein subunit POP1
VSVALVGLKASTSRMFHSNQSHLEANGDQIGVQHDLWNSLKNISNPRDISPSQVFGLVVCDPRLSLPKQKAFERALNENKNNWSFGVDDGKAQQHSLSTVALLSSCSSQDTKTKLRSSQAFSHSPLWDRAIIEDLNRTKASTYEINKERAKYLTPMADLTISRPSKVPVVLVQTTTTSTFSRLKNGSLANGWDLIVPREWGMPFWMSLVHHGAKPIALNELSYLHFESGF